MSYIDRPEPGVTRITGGFTDPPHLRAWPVGSVFISFADESPADLLGGGTWVRVVGGRMLVSYDSSDGDFSLIGGMDGVKETTIDVDNLPAHNHSAGTLVTSADGNHSHNADRKSGVGVGTGFARGDSTDTADYAVDPAGNHNHNVTGDTGNTGGGTPINNMPPYIVVAMWRRTA